jgi:hypothetical protein
MDRLRLDPADPLASVLAWLAALAQALGIEPSALRPRVQLSHAGAAVVRRWLADWSRGLRALVRAEAALLARRLSLGAPDPGRRRSSFPSPPVGEGSLRAPTPRDADRARGGAPAGRVVVLARPGGRVPPSASRRRARPAWDASIALAEEEALQRRARAVIRALRDRSALVRRLALKLAKRLARANAAQAALRGRRRFPHPSRAIGARRALAPAPEPRPPDLSASVQA